jgi:hypothetical protein
VVFAEVPRASWDLCLCVEQTFTLPAKHVPEALSRLAAETRPR